MKVMKLKKLALALGSLAILGAAGQAHAVPQQFTVNPSAIGGVGAPFKADFISGTSSELLHIANPLGSGAFSASGFLQGTGFSLNSNAVLPVDAQINISYGLYLTFQLEGFGPTSLGSTDPLTKLNFQVFADKGFATAATRTVFNQATVAGNVGTETSLSNTGDDLLVGFGSLISGVAGFDALGGVFLNAITSFSLCNGAGTALTGASPTPGVGIGPTAANCLSNIGTSYFAAPVPFFALAFNEFNNTGNGVTRSTDGTLVAIRSATGGVDFEAVPEPDTLALLGIAAVGLGLASYRRRVQSKKA